MKPIKELRTILRFHPSESNSTIKYFAEHCNIDFDVFLPTKGKNLQRDFVWSLEQKRELIWSVLLNRHIPRMAMIYTREDTHLIIDGKQRLSAMIDFYKGKFDLIIDDRNFYFSELPQDYQRAISCFMFPYYIVNELSEIKVSDEDKISWFKYINFAGTPQESEHLRGLS